jgi:hypothetical protein
MWLWAVCGLLLGFSQAMASTSSWLKNLTWEQARDSMSVTLHFAGDLPEKYRVSMTADTAGVKSLMLAFLNAEVDTQSVKPESMPKWMTVQTESDLGNTVLRINVFVMRDVVFKGEWKGNSFRVTFPNAVTKDNPFWKRPWLYVGLGAAAAGGAVIWITTGSSPNSQNIAPPDINLPE